MASTRSTVQGPGLLARAPSPALVIGGIASVQFGSAVASTLFHRIGPGGAVFLRLVFGSVWLAFIWRPWRGGGDLHRLRLAALFGLVLATMNTVFYHAIERIPLGIAVTIEFVGPLAVAIVGSRRPLDFVWAALAAAGILALTHGSTHGLDTLGVVLALIAAALWATYILVSARVGRAFADGTGLALAMCVGSVLAIPVGVIEGGAHLLSAHVLAFGALVGLLSSAIPYAFELEALRRIATHVFGVLMSLEPAIAALAGWLILGQSLAPREAAGIVLVMVASIGASRGARRAPVDV